MCRLPDDSIDMILADLPYGTTACKWDSIIPLEPLWEQYKRVIKDNGAIVLTASQPFTTKLINSNIEWFKYCWVWEKTIPTNFVLANKRPMKYHEDICVFYNKQPTFNKQMIPRSKAGKKRMQYSVDKRTNSDHISLERNKTEYNPEMKNPSSVIKIKSRYKNDTVHPTQKPVALFEYLIKTYTYENEIVLDNVIGSGTTAVACLKTDRKFIGFEKEEKYYNIALKRIGKFDKSYYNELPEKEKPKQTQLF